jgi:multidrug resistance efflux pump
MSAAAAIEMDLEAERPPGRAQSRWIGAAQARIMGQILRVTAASEGTVARVNVAAGQLVKDRELLIELDARELDRRIGEAAVGLARALTRPQRSFAHRRYVLAHLQRANAEIRAPAAGRILAARVRPRQSVTFAQALVSILDSDHLWIVARFHPRDLARLRLGQPARVVAAGRVAVAKVAALERPGGQVLVEFDGPRAAALRPGMPAFVSVAT